jgi:GxxExxY protein
MSVQLKYSDETYQIIGAAMEVHKVVGCGFTEPLYQDALEEELRLRDIPFEREKTYYFTYKGKRLDKIFRPDFVCYNKVIVELKTVADFTDEHYAQVYNYLKATGMGLGLLINFGKKSLEYKRILPNSKWNT